MEISKQDVDQMKKENAGNADLQSKITGYETKVQSLQDELAKRKIFILVNQLIRHY